MLLIILLPSNDDFIGKVGVTILVGNLGFILRFGKLRLFFSFFLIGKLALINLFRFSAYWQINLNCCNAGR